MTEPINVAIIGAGPYGLSVAAHLRGAKIPCEIFGNPIESWREHMPERMVLRSETFASSLSDPDNRYTLKAFCKLRGIPYRKSGPTLPKQRFLDYADWFQRQAVPNVKNLKVTHLARQGDGFSLTFENGDAAFARNVVVATGHRPFRNMPPCLRQLSPELVSHSDDHKDLSKFINKEVVVVGGGQSALEIAALLHEQGTATRVLVREDHVVWLDPHLGERTPWQERLWPESGLGYGWKNFAIASFPKLFSLLPRGERYRIGLGKLGPAGGWWLRDRVVGNIPLLTSHEVLHAREVDGSVRLTVQSGAKTFETDANHVIAATGYKPDVARIGFLDTASLADLKVFRGMPLLGPGCESSVPGLFFVGLLSAATFGPTMRFIAGTGHAGSMLARRFAATAEQPSQRSVPVASYPAPEIAQEQD
jgi:cation diffusion facilitator CzcD-associated flavoprotein CzcO